MSEATVSVNVGSEAASQIMVLGGTGAGKTVWIARLLEALQAPATIFNGRIVEGDPAAVGVGADTIRCEYADEATKAQNLGIMTALAARRWPSATMDPVEHLVDFFLDGQTVFRHRRRVRLLELPGSALLSAFSPSNPSTLTLGWTVGDQMARTAAIVLLVDPVAAAEQTQESIDLLNATVAMLHTIRASPDGRAVPVAIVLSKCDRGYKTILKEGGVRQFVEKHLASILSAAASARVYVSSATRSRLVSPGHREPSTRRPAENVIEPMYFLLGTLDRVETIRRRAGMRMDAEAQRRAAASRRAQRPQESGELRVSNRAWVAFGIGALLLAGGSVRFAQSRSAGASPAAPPLAGPTSPAAATDPKEVE